MLHLWLAFSIATGAEKPIDLPDGQSPDGVYAVRVQPPDVEGAMTSLEVVTVATSVVVATMDAGGYAAFPAVADVHSTAVLWSPDSRHVAVMTRGTKRSTEVRLFRVAASGVTEIPLPSATDRAFHLLKATQPYRCVFQRPTTWRDNNTLVIRASGDVRNAAGEGLPVWYEADVCYDIQKREISDAKIVETKPKEG